MTKITIVRGAFLNPFELQNYYPLTERSLDGVYTERSRSGRDDRGVKYDLRAVSSLRPLSGDIEIPLTKLPSPTDFPDFPFKYPILNRLFTDAHYLYGLDDVIKGSDIVHVAETYYNYTIQAIKAKRMGLVKKVVSTVWEVIPFNNEGIKGRKEFKKMSYKYVDHFLVVTNLARKVLLEEGVNSEKISVVPMGVDLKRFTERDPSTALRMTEERKTVNILCVARLEPEKGIDELVEAFRSIHSKNNKVKLTLVGGGSLKNNYLRTPGVEIKQVPYQQIQKEYQAADIFCLPSKTTKYWQEQFGMALIEAMACGLPIITTNTGAIGEVCGNNVIYVKPGDVKSLQVKLSELIESPQERKKYGALSRQHAVKNYDHLKIAQKIDDLYQEVLRK